MGRRIMLRYLFLAVVVMFAATSCCKDRDYPDRYDEVLVILQAGYYPGYNDLSYYMDLNFKDLSNGMLPGRYSRKAVVLVSRLTSCYAPTSSPYVCHLYKKDSKTVSDTLKAFPEDMVLTVKGNMKKVLSYVASQFPSDHYGMVFSSHGTGWLPEGYYENPSKYDSDYRGDDPIFFWTQGKFRQSRPASGENGYEPEYFRPEGPAVKSIGIESEKVDGKTIAHEFTISDFPLELPFHLDYLILDACLMGGVETAYELRNATDHLLFSQAEIMADGVCYRNLVSRLLEGEKPDLEGVVQDYYDNYIAKSGSSQSATFSLIDCHALDTLARRSARLFDRYRSSIAAVDGSKVQVFFRSGRHFFYDMDDILVKAGIPEVDLFPYRDALSDAVKSVVYTPWMLRGSGGFEVKTDCGLSMYLPSKGTPYTDAFYRTLSWNKMTGLVK